MGNGIILMQNGYMLTVWLNKGGKWYYLNLDGSKKTGWVKDDNTRFYMTSVGAVVTNMTLYISGKKYNFNSSGACINP